ncbi:MAG: esterase family protein [Clostridiales bacterium]|jgi:putative tributyrin esterase|nr:esterase family protein [Clostridiales bacterium]
MALMHVNFFSDVLGLSMSMDAIIPQTAKNQIGMKGIAGGKPYKTLYLLHGMSDDHTIWQRRTSIERFAAELGVAVIMPATALGWYTDMSHGLKWWTYISRELPEICRGFFPLSAKREDNYAAGLSMGGYGAVKLGLACGESFSHVASLSGALDLSLNFSAQNLENVKDTRSDTFWSDVFGPLEEYAGSGNDLRALAEKRKAMGNMPKIYVWCGTEDFIYNQNTSFRDYVLELGYDLTYKESPGDHQWKYWDERIQDVLDWLPVHGETE